MKEIYFITATNTDVGKSYTSEVFLNYFAKQNKKVGYFKPIETAVKDIPIDGTKLLKIAQTLNKNFQVTIDDIVPYQFSLPAAPFVASNAQHIDIKLILSKITYLLKFCDILIIEGAGGLMVPINQNYFMIDLIKDINPTNTFLVSSSQLGSINDTLLSQKLLEQYQIKYNWYINLYKDKNNFFDITFPFYKAYYDKIEFVQDFL